MCLQRRLAQTTIANRLPRLNAFHIHRCICCLGTKAGTSAIFACLIQALAVSQHDHIVLLTSSIFSPGSRSASSSTSAASRYRSSRHHPRPHSHHGELERMGVARPSASEPTTVLRMEASGESILVPRLRKMGHRRA